MDENRPASNLGALWDSKPSPAACRNRKTDVFAGFRTQHLPAYGTASLIKTVAAENFKQYTLKNQARIPMF